MAKEQVNQLLCETLVFIGDLNGMNKRLAGLLKRADELGIEIGDLPDSTTVLQKLRDEAYDLRLKIGDKLSD